MAAAAAVRLVSHIYFLLLLLPQMLSKLLRGLRFWNAPEFAGPVLDVFLVSADLFKICLDAFEFEFDPLVVSPTPLISTGRHNRADGVPR